MRVTSLLSIIGCILIPWSAVADEADVTDVEVTCNASCTFRVTVKHVDEGWIHYADRWEILSLERDILATRVLHHPHTEEQPFTRLLSGISLPADTREVILRAHDSVHGYGGAEIRARIPAMQ